mmetsp:Transcript_116126/g.369524  ORF Transcript_116126/g.369524 Transcript_116126/m.369524 type:complete len:252 (+) Transcript_116126:353-1108(+)
MAGPASAALAAAQREVALTFATAAFALALDAEAAFDTPRLANTASSAALPAEVGGGGGGGGSRASASKPKASAASAASAAPCSAACSAAWASSSASSSTAAGPRLGAGSLSSQPPTSPPPASPSSAVMVSSASTAAAFGLAARRTTRREGAVVFVAAFKVVGRIVQLLPVEGPDGASAPRPNSPALGIGGIGGAGGARGRSRLGPSFTTRLPKAGPPLASSSTSGCNPSLRSGCKPLCPYAWETIGGRGGP